MYENGNGGSALNTSGINRLLLVLVVPLLIINVGACWTFNINVLFPFITTVLLANGNDYPVIVNIMLFFFRVCKCY